MRMSVDHVADVLAAYLDEAVAPKAQGLARIGTYMFGIAAARKGADLVRQYVPTMQMLGVMDEERMLDVDAFAEIAHKAMEKAGGKLYAMGLILDQSDIDIIVDIARRYAA